MSEHDVAIRCDNHPLAECVCGWRHPHPNGGAWLDMQAAIAAHVRRGGGNTGSAPGRFSKRSRQAKLLAVVLADPMTAAEATRQILAGTEYDIATFEGTRRRVSDLHKAGLIQSHGMAAGEHGDEAIVWAVTSRGRIAYSTLKETGWSSR